MVQRRVKTRDGGNNDDADLELGGKGLAIAGDALAGCDVDVVIFLETLSASATREIRSAVTLAQRRITHTRERKQRVAIARCHAIKNNRKDNRNNDNKKHGRQVKSTQ